MILAESSIYPFIKDYPTNFEIVTYKKNSLILQASEGNKYIWFLLDGEVKVVACSSNGKRIVVDEIPTGCFVGHLSNLFGQKFFTLHLADTKCTLLQMPITDFLQLMQDIEFSRFFYLKVTNRLYIMYKKDLVKHLFYQQEQFAYHLLECSHGRTLCMMQSLYKTCEYLRMSRRNLYNILDSFIAEGALRRTEDGQIQIEDLELLKAKAQPVIAFVNNQI